MAKKKKLEMIVDRDQLDAHMAKLIQQHGILAVMNSVKWYAEDFEGAWRDAAGALEECIGNIPSSLDPYVEED
jgi:hypothetical protein